MSLTREQLRAYRLEVARREAPRTMRYVLAVFTASAALNAVFGVSDIRDWIVDVVVVVNLLLALWVTTNRRIPDAWSPWAMAHAGVVMSVTSVFQAWVSPSATDFAYLIVIMVGYPPFVMAWLPMVSAAVPLTVGFLALASSGGTTDVAAWGTVCVTALAIGLVLLGSRLHIIDSLAEAAELARSLATRDKLTDVLNRHGLEERVPDLLAIAQRRGEPVFATFIDIDGLKRANDMHGHDFGDRVIRAVADAITREARAGDLVARWGGDEFVVVGFGDQPTIEAIDERLHQSILDTGIQSERWAGNVSLGMAMTRDGNMETLLREADEDMYRRRRERRAGV